MVLHSTFLALVLWITAYAPACGGINGSLKNKYADGSSTPQLEHHLNVVACGAQFDFGTVFQVQGLDEFGITTVTCHDRGSSVTGLDVLVYTGKGCKADLALAYKIGRRRRQVTVESEE